MNHPLKKLIKSASLIESLAKKYGWVAKTSLEEGFWKTYKSFSKTLNNKN